MRVSRLLSAICEQKATGKGFRFRWVWVSGRLVRCVWWVSIVKCAAILFVGQRPSTLHVYSVLACL